MRAVSDFMPEDIQTIPKTAVRGTIGFIKGDSEVMREIDKAMMMQLGLGDVGKS